MNLGLMGPWPISSFDPLFQTGDPLTIRHSKRPATTRMLFGTIDGGYEDPPESNSNVPSLTTIEIHPKRLADGITFKVIPALQDGGKESSLQGNGMPPEPADEIYSLNLRREISLAPSKRTLPPSQSVCGEEQRSCTDPRPE